MTTLSPPTRRGGVAALLGGLLALGLASPTARAGDFALDIDVDIDHLPRVSRFLGGYYGGGIYSRGRSVAISRAYRARDCNVPTVARWGGRWGYGYAGATVVRPRTFAYRGGCYVPPPVAYDCGPVRTYRGFGVGIGFGYGYQARGYYGTRSLGRGCRW